MTWKLTRRALASVAVASTFLGASFVVAQDPAKPKDEALDKLLEKLEGSNESAKTPSTPAEGAGKASGKSEGRKNPGEVAPKDKEIDSLLEKLGERTDEPTPDDRPKKGPGSNDDQQPKEPQGKSDGLSGQSKKLDEHLEELSGRKRKKKDGGEGGEGSGPLADVIKRMREVEQRLGKPDTGEETRKKQSEIVKNLDQMIEQLRQSSSQSSSKKKSLAMKPGSQPGSKSDTNSPGTTGGNAPHTKPAKPTEKRSLAGGKDEWGHLPPELRQELENVFKEEALERKADLIRRYYLSLSKKRLSREE